MRACVCKCLCAMQLRFSLCHPLADGTPPKLAFAAAYCSCRRTVGQSACVRTYVLHVLYVAQALSFCHLDPLSACYAQNCPRRKRALAVAAVAEVIALVQDGNGGGDSLRCTRRCDRLVVRAGHVVVCFTYVYCCCSRRSTAEARQRTSTTQAPLDSAGSSITS